MRTGLLRNGVLRGGMTLLPLAFAVGACTEGAPPVDGRWVGDLRPAGRADRLEVTIDSGGRVARISTRLWRRREAPASRLSSERSELAYLSAGDADTVGFRGAIRADVWSGTAIRGADTAGFELHRLHPWNDQDWAGLVGTYRAEAGGLLAVAPFTEFGDTPMLVNFATGRLAPLLPIGRDRLLVGHSLVAPVFPADTLEVTRGPAGEVTAIRFARLGLGPVLAERLATRDEEVEFPNGEVTLRGTVTLPADSAPYPAIVLVHGSGPLTREAFGPWTRFMAGLGFAVLSFDKRGTGRSTGDWKQSDFNDLAGDVLAGVRLLAGRQDIRPDRIGLFGISQGGWIGPLAASQAPGEIAFLAIHAGTGTTVKEQGLLNLQYELRFAGFSDSSIALAARYHALDDSVTRTGQGLTEMERFYESHRATEPWLYEPAPADAWFRSFYRRIMDFDPASSWARVKCPVLLFFGELDANVPPRESWPPIDRALRRAGNQAVTQVTFPKANHLLLAAQTGARDEYPHLSHFVSGYFDRMASWLAERAR